MALLLKYPLDQSYLHDWLVAGPAVQGQGDQAPTEIAQLLTETPAEQTTFSYQGQPCTWQVVICGDDHFVDLTDLAVGQTCIAWAYAQIATPIAGEFTGTLTTYGPADIWLNGQHCYQQTATAGSTRTSTQFSLPLEAGLNELLVQFTKAAADASPYVLALRLDPTADLTINLPTTVPAVERRQKLERLFAAAYLDRPIYYRDQELKVHWPADLGLADEITIRLQSPSGRIYAEAHPFWVKPGAVANLGRVYQVPEGEYQVVLLPRLVEYYEQGLKVQRRLHLQVVNSPHSERSYVTYGERRLEALDSAARRQDHLFAEIAKMALGRWPQVKRMVIEQGMQHLNLQSGIGLCGLLARYGGDPDFPPGLAEQIQTALLTWHVAANTPDDEPTENQQLLGSTYELLVGQLDPTPTGPWHRERGERQLLAWLRQAAAGGFQTLDAPVAFADAVLALTHLSDLAQNVDVAEMAAILLDKLCFTLALNSLKGIFGSSHSSTETAMIQGGRLEATAGISRLLWGLGTFNSHIIGTVSLACAAYELPPLIAQIANDQPAELWSRECHRLGGWEVNKATYKTPDYLLASAQDDRPGLAGNQEHSWQATFGPDAVVFVNHPPCISTAETHRPNFWRGNGVRPRVAQWRDLLVAIYQLPEDDWLSFTHAYFPTAAFDEYQLRGGWAFACKGNGYLALTAANELALITAGSSAFTELRAYGEQQIWLCHMGRAAQDGSFAEFVQKVLALDITFEAHALHATTLRGESIDFGWDGPLLVNEIEQPLRGFKHYESSYCVAELNATHMEIQFEDQLLRLDFTMPDDSAIDSMLS